MTGVTDRSPGPTSYDVSATWAYLSKHVPGVLLAAAATQVAAAAAVRVEQRCQRLGGSSTLAPCRQPIISCQGGLVDADAEERAEQQAVWYDLTRALKHVKPRVPAWGFAPVPILRASFTGTKRGNSGAGLELFYDVSVRLVKKRTPGVLSLS
jgi:hypothetical protein